MMMKIKADEDYDKPNWSRSRKVRQKGRPLAAALI
jgi:hypothetical protein